MELHIKILLTLLIFIILFPILTLEVQTYQEPVYKTLYKGKLTYKILGQVVDEYSFNGATSYNIEKFGMAYKVTVCYDSQCDKTFLANDGVNKIQSYPSQIIIGNETRYRIETKEFVKKIW